MLILLIAFVLSTSAMTDHPLEFDEFEAQEQLMQYQINLWELFNQLTYAQGELRARVLSDIEQMRVIIQQQIDLILSLDQKYHGGK